MATAITVTPGAAAASTWHYLYAYNSAGVIVYETSTTAPGTNIIFKFVARVWRP